MGLHLSERDARTLATNVVKHVSALGGRVEQFGVHLQPEGFYFMARVNGRTVWCQTGQGNFHYHRIAAELLDAALKAQTDPWVASDQTPETRHPSPVLT